jgi:hypothetical protein
VAREKARDLLAAGDVDGAGSACADHDRPVQRFALALGEAEVEDHDIDLAKVDVRPERSEPVLDQEVTAVGVGGRDDRVRLALHRASHGPQ